MKRHIPLLITAVGGFVLIVSFFIPVLQSWGENVSVWFDILASIAFILGGGNLLAVHLRKISDRRAGWGYSAITLAAFGATLAIGLGKFGAPPAPQTEFYGESFIPYPAEALPEFTVPGEIPVRGDGKPLPASVRVTLPPQLIARQGQVRFRGWMTPAQQSDLANYHDTLVWRAVVDELAELAQPPAELNGKLTYYAEHGALSWSGTMSADERAGLTTLLGDSPSAAAAVEALWTAAQAETALEDAAPPTGFAIPAEHADVVTLQGGRLVVRGPVSERLRSQLAVDWTNPPRVRPTPAADRAAERSRLEALGSEFTERQAELFERVHDAVWSPEQLIQSLNSAGMPPAGRKSARELLTERNAGERNLTAARPAPPGVQLTPAQEEAVRGIADEPARTAAELLVDLQAGGEFTAGQSAALTGFLRQQPTVAEFRQRLAFDLQRLHRSDPTVPALTPRQANYLLAETRAQAAWQRRVDDLFRRSHRPKFPWSGEYSAPGSPFDWIYRYVFQPMTATMFAMLAFYVASAAFRAFRAKNVEAILLLGTAFLILLMNTAVGVWATSWVPDWLSALRADELKRYITVIFVTAGSRAIMIGIALGVVATSLRILLGVDRSYLGGDD